MKRKSELWQRTTEWSTGGNTRKAIRKAAPIPIESQCEVLNFSGRYELRNIELLFVSWCI